MYKMLVYIYLLFTIITRAGILIRIDPNCRNTSKKRIYKAIVRKIFFGVDEEGG